MAYAEQDAMSRDVTFQRKLAAALGNTANAVQSEAPGTANHDKRQLLAQEVARDTFGWAARMAQCIIQSSASLKTAANTGGTAGPWTVNDADLDTAASSVWNVFARVTT